MEQAPIGTNEKLAEYLFRQLNQLEVRLNDVTNRVHKDLLMYQFTFSTATTDTDPGTGKLKINNAAKASATYLYISKHPLENVHLNGIFDVLKIRDTIELSLATNVTDYAKYYVAGPAVASGSYYKIPLILMHSAGAEFANNATLNVQVYY